MFKFMALRSGEILTVKCSTLVVRKRRGHVDKNALLSIH